MAIATAAAILVDDRRIPGSPCYLPTEAFQGQELLHYSERSKSLEELDEDVDVKTHFVGSDGESLPQPRVLDYRRAIRTALERPQSNAAHMLHLLIICIIVASTCAAVLETVPELFKEYETVFKASEVVFTVVFTIEIIIRVCVAESIREYFTRLSNLVDILATLPWYAQLLVHNVLPAGQTDRAEQLAGSLRALRMIRLARMVRLLRVLRLAKAARHSEVISTVLESIMESFSGAFVLLFLVAMGSLLGATAAYVAESDKPGSKFESIPASLWWSLATISTVGYGDMVPTTFAGKCVGAVTMVGGILIVSISVAVITTNFTEAYQRRLHQKQVAKLAQRGYPGRGCGSCGGSGKFAATPRSAASSARHSDAAYIGETLQRLEEDLQMTFQRLEAEILACGRTVSNGYHSEAKNLELVPESIASMIALDVMQEQSRTLFKNASRLAGHLASVRGDKSSPQSHPTPGRMDMSRLP